MRNGQKLFDIITSIKIYSNCQFYIYKFKYIPNMCIIKCSPTYMHVRIYVALSKKLRHTCVSKRLRKTISPDKIYQVCYLTLWLCMRTLICVWYCINCNLIVLIFSSDILMFRGWWWSNSYVTTLYHPQLTDSTTYYILQLSMFMLNIRLFLTNNLSLLPLIQCILIHFVWKIIKYFIVLSYAILHCVYYKAKNTTL